MKIIKTKTGEEVLLSDCSYEAVKNYSWKIVNGRAARTGMGEKKSCGKWKRPTIYMHRMVMSAPDGVQVDHINRNPLDNRIENLRFCSSVENNRNRASSTGLSKYKGVTFDKRRKKWYAQTKLSGKRVHLGTFENERDAAIAYNVYAQRNFGEFALLNEVAA